MYKLEHKNQIVAFANFINTFEWQFFCTFTTPYSLSLASSRRSMDKLKNYLDNQFTGSKVFWFAEEFDVKEGYHIHALIQLEKCDQNSLDKNITALKKAWKILSRGDRKSILNTHIVQYDKDKGGNFYVSKYINRPNINDYDLLL